MPISNERWEQMEKDRIRRNIDSICSRLQALKRLSLATAQSRIAVDRTVSLCERALHRSGTTDQRGDVGSLHG